MKKLLISGVSVFALGFATTAMAGNVSTVDQIGANNSASVDQTGGNNGLSDVNQSNASGSGDTAFVTQSDDASSDAGTAVNDALIDQIAGSGSQLATINQTNATDGAVNTARITQDNTQGDNVGSIAQDGAGNTASVDQGPAEATFLIFPFPTPLSTDNNTASITQSGDGNIASTAQIFETNGGSGNSAEIGQDGDANMASITQGTGTGIFNPASNDNENSARIGQMGMSNDSSILQGGEFSDAQNDQNGVGNISSITQSGGVPGLLGNSALVTQTGDNNNSTVNQTDTLTGDLPLVPAGDFAVVTQTGNDNTSTVDQGPLGGHTALVTQTGNDNDSDVNQAGLLNFAEVTQLTQDNTSEVNQDDGLLITPLGNTATVTQGVLGTVNNLSVVNQVGALNVSTVMQ